MHFTKTLCISTKYYKNYYKKNYTKNNKNFLFQSDVKIRKRYIDKK